MIDFEKARSLEELQALRLYFHNCRYDKLVAERLERGILSDASEPRTTLEVNAEQMALQLVDALNLCREGKVYNVTLPEFPVIETNVVALKRKEPNGSIFRLTQPAESPDVVLIKLKHKERGRMKSLDNFVDNLEDYCASEPIRKFMRLMPEKQFQKLVSVSQMASVSCRSTSHEYWLALPGYFASRSLDGNAVLLVRKAHLWFQVCTWYNGLRRPTDRKSIRRGASK